MFLFTSIPNHTIPTLHTDKKNYSSNNFTTHSLGFYSVSPLVEACWFIVAIVVVPISLPTDTGHFKAVPLRIMVIFVVLPFPVI